MTKKILVIGGYGNFGGFISKILAREDTIQLAIAGRSLEKAQKFANALMAVHAPQAIALDIDNNFAQDLAKVAPDIVIHTSGPYQAQGYGVAKACIAHGCHYIDLADGRAFVENISTLDANAKKSDVLVCSGASSVPALTSAIVEKYLSQFGVLKSLDYGIATAHLTNRGLATTSAVLSYAGKPFKTLRQGRMVDVYGWLDLRFRKCRDLGWRAMGNCDIPDLALFPVLYPQLQTIRFQAGLELAFLHLGLWFLSWLVRFRILRSLLGTEEVLLRISHLLDNVGRDNSGFYMSLSGTDHQGQEKEIVFDIVARHGDGLNIPSMPSIILARKLARDEISVRGAMPCVGLITLEEYLLSLKEFNIDWKETII